MSPCCRPSFLRRTAAPAFAALCILAAGCSKESFEPAGPASKVVEEAVSQIVALVSPGKGVAVVMRELDVSGMSAEDFKSVLEEFDAENVTVWMPGEDRWLLIGWNGDAKVSLASALETFAVDSESTASPTDAFASYAGMREDIMPAFGSRLEGNVVPEWFMTRSLPYMDWLDTSGIDRDIVRRTLAEIRSVQISRRVVLEGNMIARTAKEKKDEEAAAEKWAKAYLRNPKDPMLLERLDKLSRNAHGFLEVGKVLQAMKCYETMLLVNPNNAVAVHNFGMCLRKIGKVDLAEKALKRAKALERAAGGP